MNRSRNKGQTLDRLWVFQHALVWLATLTRTKRREKRKAAISVLSSAGILAPGQPRAGALINRGQQNAPTFPFAAFQTSRTVVILWAHRPQAPSGRCSCAAQILQHHIAGALPPSWRPTPAWATALEETAALLLEKGSVCFVSKSPPICLVVPLRAPPACFRCGCSALILIQPMCSVPRSKGVLQGVLKERAQSSTAAGACVLSQQPANQKPLKLLEGSGDLVSRL